MYFNCPHLKLIHYKILSYCLGNIASGKAEYKNICGETAYWFSLNDISTSLNLSYQQVQRGLARLEGKDKYKIEPLIKSIIVHSHTDFSRLYLFFDFNKIFKALNYNSELELTREIMGTYKIEPLFDIEDDGGKINAYADNIARKILSVYPSLFRTRAGKTKTYQNACKIICDIYNGAYTSPRMYNLRNAAHCKWFDVSGWKDKIKQVRGNWTAVEHLLIKAAGNFQAMFDARNMPENKVHLPRGLEEWLYDRNNEDYPSYFVFSLNPPNSTKKQYSEMKADRIFDMLPRKLQESGNRLHDILPKNTYQVILWENVLKMWQWAKMVMRNDSNAIYWFNSAADIVDKFIAYCIENKITISANTLNPETGVRTNAPFSWFVQDAISKYGLNSNLCNCATENDFERFYKA